MTSCQRPLKRIHSQACFATRNDLQDACSAIPREEIPRLHARPRRERDWGRGRVFVHLAGLFGQRACKTFKAVLGLPHTMISTMP